MRLFLHSCFICLLGFGSTASRADISPDFFATLKSQVFKVIARRSSGTVQAGSAVLVAPGKLVTNCHVLRWTGRVEVLQNGARWPARLVSADAEHDLCILAAETVPTKAIAFARPAQLKTDQEVHAAGYPGGGEFVVNCGTIRALHDLDAGKVIQTNASFSPGASGGGLFDSDGRLIGILTFRAVTGGDLHFVMPVAWVDALLARSDDSAKSTIDNSAFYHRIDSRQPYFLRAVVLEKQQNWPALLGMAQRWAEDQANSTEPWMAMGKACVALNKKDEAVAAFRQVLSIDEHHSHGKNWLLALMPPGPHCGGEMCEGDGHIFSLAEPVLP